MNRRTFLRNAGWVSTGLIFVPRLIRAQTILTADGLAAFKKKPAGGGGGGGGGWTLLAHIGQTGATGGTTCGAIDTTGANLIVLAVCHLNNDSLTVTDSKSNSYTLTTRNGTTRWAYCVPSSVGSVHTFTATAGAGGASFQVYAFAKSGGTPSFDAISTNTSSGNWSGGLQQGSLTPASANDLFLSAIAFDTITGSGATINSSFTRTDSPKKGTNGVGISSAYKIKTSDSSAEAPTWADGEGSNPDGWCIGICFQ